MIITVSERSTPIQFIQALGVLTAAPTIYAKRGDTAAYDFVFDSGNGDGLAREIDPTPGTLTSFRFGAKVVGDLAGNYVISNYSGGTYVVTKTGGSTFTDAVLNSTTTLTSATAGFMQSDVGLAIAGTGIPAGTTIAAVASATSITLSAAATATASGVTIRITGRTPTYTVAPDFNADELNTLLIDGTISQTVANEAARYALTGLALGTIVKQTDTLAFWKVIDIAQLGNAAGWSTNVPQKASVTLSCELEYIVSGGRSSTVLGSLVVENDLNRGTEGIPTSSNPAYPTVNQIILWRSDLTAFTGGTSAALDAIAVDSTWANRVVALVETSEGVESHWRLTAGTDAESVPAGIVRPDNYHASTNAYVWVRIQ